ERFVGANAGDLARHNQHIEVLAGEGVGDLRGRITCEIRCSADIAHSVGEIVSQAYSVLHRGFVEDVSSSDMQLVALGGNRNAASCLGLQLFDGALLGCGGWW